MAINLSANTIATFRFLLGTLSFCVSINVAKPGALSVLTLTRRLRQSRQPVRVLLWALRRCWALLSLWVIATGVAISTEGDSLRLTGLPDGRPRQKTIKRAGERVSGLLVQDRFRRTGQAQSKDMGW